MATQLFHQKEEVGCTVDLRAFVKLFEELDINKEGFLSESKIEKLQAPNQMQPAGNGELSLNQDAIPEAPLQKQPDELVLTLPSGFQKRMPLVGFLNGEKVYQCPPEIEALVLPPKIRQKTKVDLDKEVEKPYIKKPPNAFMIFMKEQRSKILPEILKQGSGAVNAVLGKMWKLLSVKEKAIYFTEAARCKKIHQLENPGWSNKDNYGKKRKRERIRARKPSNHISNFEMFWKREPEKQQNVMPGNHMPLGATQPCYPQAPYMQNHHPQQAYVQFPQQQQYMQYPQQRGYMQFPQQAGYMQSPQQAGYMQPPQQGYMQFLKQGGYMQFPQQGGYMQFPQQGGYILFPQQGYMQEPRQAANEPLLQPEADEQNPLQGTCTNDPQPVAISTHPKPTYSNSLAEDDDDDAID